MICPSFTASLSNLKCLSRYSQLTNGLNLRRELPVKYIVFEIKCQKEQVETSYDGRIIEGTVEPVRPGVFVGSGRIYRGFGFEAIIVLISMPLINRNINHVVDAGDAQERVKIEEPASEMEESVVSAESKELAEGKWNEQENLRFVIFIHYYQDIFSSKHKRKVSKIFKTFQEYLQDRTAAQCRSHYQKIIQKFKTVAKVKKYYEAYYGKDLYRSEFENFKAKWEETHPPLPNKDTYIKEFKEISIQTDTFEEKPQRRFCSQCSGFIQPQQTINYELPVTPPMSSPPEFNPYYYWNQMGLNYYCVFPARSEETIDLS